MVDLPDIANSTFSTVSYVSAYSLSPRLTDGGDQNHLENNAFVVTVLGKRSGFSRSVQIAEAVTCQLCMLIIA